MGHTAKILSLVILFVVSIICGIVPYFLLKWLSKRFFNSPKFKEVISLFNCFSGGVFFATSVLGILPEARDKMDQLMARLSSDLDYPLTETMLGVGFLGILLIENIALTCASGKKTGLYEELGTDSSSHAYGSTDRTSEDDTSGTGKAEKPDGTNTEESGTVGHKTLDGTAHDNHSHVAHGSHIHVTDLTNLRSVVLVVALSVHMIFDGLELGLLDSNDKIWSLLLALCIHKSLIFFSVGLTLSETVPNTRAIFAMILIMAIVSPIGGGIGIILMAQTRGVVAKTVSAFLQGIAVGTFIYVTFFEILLREFSKKLAAGILRSFAVIYGFTLFAVLRYIVCE